MRLRGAITVFLSLTIVCILSLFLGLLESARTTGARLYAQMAADSAAASVMSRYNRNLWDRYHLLFLETESEKAVEQSFSEYLSYYMEQDNWYAMKAAGVDVTEMTGMMDDGGVWLENSAIDNIIYRLPDVAKDLAGIAEEAKNASKVGDFQELFDICRQTGRKTRRLENCRRNVENSLERMRYQLEQLEHAAGTESEGQFKRSAKVLEKEMKGFSGLINRYEDEVQRLSNHRLELFNETNNGKPLETEEVSTQVSQELLAYEQVEAAAREQLSQYREMEPVIERSLALLEEAYTLLEEERYETVYVNGIPEEVPLGPDWDAVCGAVSELTIPGKPINEAVDSEKLSLLDRLEEVFQGDLLSLVLPVGTELSKNSVSLNGIPSKVRAGSLGENEIKSKQSVTDRLLVNEYCILNFGSFIGEGISLESKEGTVLEKRPLLYEQEYLVCGERSDRENLSAAVEKLLTVRGAMNLLYLLRSPEKLAEAQQFSMAISGGSAPILLILNFFVLTVWAFGEAVLDVKQLLNGGKVSFWKEAGQWKLDLDGLLSFRFLDPVSESCEEGQDYTDHMRILMFLMDREERNYRMMDVIQWNMRMIQEDFAVSDCKYRIDLETTVQEKHRFLRHDTYTRTVRTVGTY